MRIIVDTNILIRITDVRTEMPKTYADVLRMSAELGFEIAYLSSQVEDFNRDKNLVRREINLSRMRQYQEIDDAPDPSAEELLRYRWSTNNPNDEVDNQLLYAIKRNVADFLVTQDKGIHAKARRENLQEQVLTIEALCEFLKEQVNARREIHPISAKVKRIKAYQLRIEDTFFDSLRDSYAGFNDWFAKISREGREAWVVRGDQQQILGLCIYKTENGEQITDGGYLSSGKTLKLCTFKVAGVGSKLGECLLQEAFNFAILNGFSSIYLHVRLGSHPRLVSLLEDFGFKSIGLYNEDEVFLKMMVPSRNRRFSMDSSTNVDFDIDYYPRHFDGTGVAKYMIPIQPEYHEKLFPDVYGKGLFSQGDGFVYSSESNAIKKAYICNSNIKRIRPGDLVLFYRSHDVRGIDTVGFVEKVTLTADFNKVFALVARRTVFTDVAIREKLRGKAALVILFRLIQHLQEPVSRRLLDEAGMVGEIQSVRRMPERMYRTLLKPRLYPWGLSCDPAEWYNT